MSTSRYLASAPKRETEEKSKNPEFCDVMDCTSYYPGNGKPGLRGKAGVVLKGPSGELVGRCCYHYDRELYRMGKGRHSPMMGGAVDLTLDMVREHWRGLDATEAQKSAKRAGQIELRREPVKAYTEADA